MPHYRAKIEGRFEKSVDIEAASEAEAREKLLDGEGDYIEESFLGEGDVIDIDEVEA